MPGCSEPCVAMDILVSNGKRCANHVPNEWLYELQKNAWEMFGKAEISKILNYETVAYPAPKLVKHEMLAQNDIDKLMIEMNEAKEKQTPA